MQPDFMMKKPVHSNAKRVAKPNPRDARLKAASGEVQPEVQAQANGSPTRAEEQDRDDGAVVLHLGGAIGAGGLLAAAAGGAGDTQTILAPLVSANRAPLLTLQSGTVTQQGQPVMAVFTATDPDGDALTYSVTQGVNGSASIGAGAITYTPKPGYVGLDSVTATVSDGRGGSVSQTLTIQVRDNVAPQFTSSAKVEIAENSGSGQVVYRASASDASPLTYALRSWDDAAAFSIDAATGAVTLRDNPDFERKSSYQFTVVATDAAGSSAEQAVTLQVTDVFEDVTAPVFTSGATAAAVDEHSAAGQVVYTATATDATSLSYSLKNTADAAAFSINSASGAVTLLGSPDYETKASYAFTVVATDRAGNTSEKAVSLAVNDVEELSVFATASGFSVRAAYAGSISMSVSGVLGDFAAGTTVLTEQAVVKQGFLTLTANGQSISTTPQYVVLGTAVGETIDTRPGGNRIDYILAGGGDDTIVSGPGVDIVKAGSGDDTIIFYALEGFVAGGAVVDSIDGGSGDNTIQLNIDGFTISATDSFSRVSNFQLLTAGLATARPISITLNADAFSAGIYSISLAKDTNDAGANLIDASAATSTVRGLFLTGSEGDDTIIGGAGNDEIRGGDGGVDTLEGRGGDDRFYYGLSSDLFDGRLAVDRIDGGAGTNTLVLGDQTLTVHYLFEITDDESFSRISGISRIEAVPGDKVEYSLTLANDAYEAGLRVIDLSANTDTADLNIIDVSAETGTANGYTLIGHAGEDKITGGAGADTITGGAGKDQIAGGSGGDTMIYSASFGGSSDSNFNNMDKITDFDTANDLFVFKLSNLSNFNTSSNFVVTNRWAGENLLIIDASGSGNDGSGAPGSIAIAIGAVNSSDAAGRIAYELTGTTGANTLSGGGRADTITGGAGADTVAGGAGNDLFVYRVGDASGFTFNGSGTEGIAREPRLNNTYSAVDVISDFASGDRIDLGNSLLQKADDISAGNKFRFVFGTFSNGTFNVVNDNQTDALLLYDADSATAGLQLEAIVIRGLSYNTSLTLGMSDGILTFG